MVHRLNPWRTVVEAGQPWRRRAGAIGLVVGVAVIHGCVAEHVSDAMLDLTMESPMPKRIEAMYVREMEPTAPAAIGAAMAPAKQARAPQSRAAAAARPASGPDESMTEAVLGELQPPEPQPVEPAASQALAQVVDEPMSAASAAASAVAEPVDTSASAASAVAGAASAASFNWPASTRLSYVLTGNYQGEIHGTAQVEWVRQGNRYQVHMDVTVGLSFLPLLSRKMTSDGQLTPEGLFPHSYDEDSKVAGRDRRRSTIRFEPDAIVMPDGRRRQRWPGVQDAASQFVQMTYLFTLRPQLLAPGNTIEIPLALPRNVDWWLYDVLGTETLYTPFGAVDAVHLKPRRAARKGGDLTIEMWFAPSLAYLPARIRIHQDADTFIDLVISRKPQLAAQ